jgi:hypothetical protein
MISFGLTLPLPSQAMISGLVAAVAGLTKVNPLAAIPSPAMAIPTTRILCERIMSLSFD